MDFLKECTAGAAGGVAQCFTGHPLDTIKVTMVSNPAKYPDLSSTARQLVAEGGFGRLYKGVQSPLTGLTLMNILCFSSNAQARRFIGEETTMQLAAAGGVAGAFASLAESPIDLIKCQLQVRGELYNGFVDCAKTVTRQHGIAGLYQGMSATLLRNIQGNAFYFGIFETLCRYDPHRSASTILAAGAIGGIGYWGLAYQFDVVKTRLQSQSLVRSEQEFTGLVDAFRKIHARSGLRGFFIGYTPCMVRAVPANAATFYAYSVVREHLG
jgi:solute carrier family 25 carnitine/acylcarnitine transporter 20/29